MTDAEAKRLLGQYRETGNVRFLHEVAEAYRGLVQSFASRYYTDSREDLFQAGMVGLMKGLERFDLSRATCVSTYVTFWVRAHLSAHVADFPTGAGVIESLDVRNSANQLKLDTIIDENAISEEMIEDCQETVIQLHWLQEALNGLSSRERHIILARFAERPIRLRVLAEQYGISKERVRQIENKTLAALSLVLHRRRRFIPRYSKETSNEQ